MIYLSRTCSFSTLVLLNSQRAMTNVNRDYSDPTGMMVSSGNYPKITFLHCGDIVFIHINTTIQQDPHKNCLYTTHTSALFIL